MEIFIILFSVEDWNPRTVDSKLTDFISKPQDLCRITFTSDSFLTLRVVYFTHLVHKGVLRLFPSSKKCFLNVLRAVISSRPTSCNREFAVDIPHLSLQGIHRKNYETFRTSVLYLVMITFEVIRSIVPHKYISFWAAF